MSLKNLIIVARLMLALALVSVIVTLSWPHVTHAQPASASAAPTDGTEVAEVRVSGNLRVESRSILTQITTKPGQRLSRKRLGADLRKVWRMGYFEDIQIDARFDDAGMAILTFIVAEKPAIAEVRYEGNSDLSTDDIKEVVDLAKFQILDDGKVKANAEKIRQLYEEKGYYLAEVEPAVEPVEGQAGQANVVFKIREYAKVQVRKVTFLGNEAIPDEELSQIMGTRAGDWLSFVSSFGSFKAETFEADMQRLTAYYYDKGFVEVKIGAPSIRLSRDRRYLYLTIPLEEGPRYKVGSVAVTGDMIKPKDELEAMTKLKPGETFSYGTLRQDIEKLRALYQDAGYAYANVNQLMRPNPDSLTLDVTYDIQQGSKVYFGRIEVAGNTKTRDKVIRRELVIQEGDLFSNEKLQQSKQLVFRLGFFEDVQVTTQRGEREDVINVEVRVVERPTGTFQAGAGFSSQENILANLQVAQNNLFGRGQILTFTFQWSGIRTLFNLRFFEPYLLDTKLRLTLSGYNFDFIFQDYQQQSTGGNVTLGYPLIDNRNRTGTEDLSVSLTYKLEDVTIRPGGISGRDARQVGSLFRGGLTSSVQGALIYDSRDNIFFPTKGQFHTARAEFADDTLTGSQTEFIKYDLDANLFVPLFWQFVLRLNGQMGYITSIDPNKGVPLQERYLMGGPNTIRGFQRFSLGPSRLVPSNTGDPGSPASAFVIGGTKQLLFTAEVLFPILTAINLQGVLFADAGNAFGDNQPYALTLDVFQDNQNRYEDALRTNLGFGFRWFSPIGLLRFEWGVPLARLRDEDPLVFNFNIGNAF